MIRELKIRWLKWRIKRIEYKISDWKSRYWGTGLENLGIPELREKLYKLREELKRLGGGKDGDKDE